METQNKTMDKIRCTNCKCWREPADYIGKKGVSVKRCVKCREKDARQKKRPDVIEKNNERQRDKKYYIQYRENKRKEDEEGYLKHNAKIAKAWRENNKAHVSAWRTNNVTYRLSGIKQQAKKKNIKWSDDMTDEICEKLMKSNCVYCGYLSDDTLNGIDRMDSQSCYNLQNCVSCCKNCNFVKKCLDPITFIARTQHISHVHNGHGKLDDTVWCDSGSVDYKAYLTRAADKDLEFALTKEMFDKIKSACCYYCGKVNSSTHQNGIDRKDNSVGYIIENCATCCRECNQMKGVMSSDEFISHCKNIALYKQSSFDSNIPRTLSVIKSRKF
jgi:hypothetical protein